MVVAQQILFAASVLHQGAQGSAAAVDNRVAVSVEVIVIAAGAAKKHWSGHLPLVACGVAGDTRSVQEDGCLRPGEQIAGACDDIDHVGRLDG